MLSRAPAPFCLEAPQAHKKAYSERLSKQLAFEVADRLRQVGFAGAKPLRNGPGEREFQGGLGPKKVDVTYSDERHGLILAVSIKSINCPPFGKNLRNRFADLCTEAITLHMRFPYAVVCLLFAFPAQADADVTPGRPISTFRKAMKLLATIGGRNDHTDPAEKFEHVALMLYDPANQGIQPWVRVFDATTGAEFDEEDYPRRIRQIYDKRNPHAILGET